MIDYDVIIIGGGPAALTAGLYIARDNKKVAIFEKNVEGGRILETMLVDNIPGCPHISGTDFGMILGEQATEAGVIIHYEEVKRVESINLLIYTQDYNPIKYNIYTEEGCYSCKAIIIATGTQPRMLGLPGEQNLIGNGLSFCAICDGAFYKNRNVIVIGGGNSAITEALALSEICKTVTIVQNLPWLTADKVLVNTLHNKENIIYYFNQYILEYIINDSGRCIGVKTQYNSNSKDYVINEIIADGVFLSIGMTPQTNILGCMIQKDAHGYIVTHDGHKTSATSIWACGDCRSDTYKQVAIACGDGAATALEVLEYLRGMNG